MTTQAMRKFVNNVTVTSNRVEQGGGMRVVGKNQVTIELQEQQQYMKQIMSALLDIIWN